LTPAPPALAPPDAPAPPGPAAPLTPTPPAAAPLLPPLLPLPPLVPLPLLPLPLPPLPLPPPLPPPLASAMPTSEMSGLTATSGAASGTRAKTAAQVREARSRRIMAGPPSSSGRQCCPTRPSLNLIPAYPPDNRVNPLKQLARRPAPAGWGLYLGSASGDNLRAPEP